MVCLFAVRGLAGWLVGWLAERLAGWLTERSGAEPTHYQMVAYCSLLLNVVAYHNPLLHIGACCQVLHMRPVDAYVCLLQLVDDIAAD